VVFHQAAPNNFEAAFFTMKRIKANKPRAEAQRNRKRTNRTKHLPQTPRNRERDKIGEFLFVILSVFAPQRQKIPFDFFVG